MIHRFVPRSLELLVIAALALALTGCPSKEEKKDAMAAKIHEKTSIPDQSGDTNFLAFMARLRMAVAKRDLQVIASMMTSDFGYRQIGRASCRERVNALHRRNHARANRHGGEPGHATVCRGWRLPQKRTFRGQTHPLREGRLMLCTTPNPSLG